MKLNPGIFAALGAAALFGLSTPIAKGGSMGPLAIAGACIAWAIDNNLTRKVSINDAPCYGRSLGA